MTDPAKPLTSDDLARRARYVLLGAVALTILLYLIPYGRLIAWPLVLFSTFVHEMGHGIAAVLVGERFDALYVWADASGVADIHGRPDARLARAFVSAGGLVGPAIGAFLFFALGGRPNLARIGCYLMGAGMVLAVLLVVRNLFGGIFVLLLGLALLLIAWRGTAAVVQSVLVFVAVQLSLSVFSRGDYLFTPQARTAGGVMPSDTQQIANALFLPYWFWGALVGAFSVFVLLCGLRIYFRGTREVPRVP